MNKYTVQLSILSTYKCVGKTTIEANSRGDAALRISSIDVNSVLWKRESKSCDTVHMEGITLQEVDANNVK